MTISVRQRSFHLEEVSMTTDDGLAIIGPGDGDRFGDITVLARAADGDGRWGVAIVSGRPGEGGRTHVHRGEAEAFFILEGELELLGATSTTPVGPGTFVLVPPDTEHGLRILGSREARWLAVWPPALDGLPEELEQAGGDPSALAAVRERHGMAAGRRR